MGRARKRADRIRERVGIVQFLSDMGYAIQPHGGDREQQFSCDLHGDGSDSKPSARVYPSSNSWYCFACSKKRDSITTLMERKGLSFHQACDTIEQTYGLPPMPFEKEENEFDELATFEQNQQSFDTMKKRIDNLLKVQSVERAISLSQYLSLWEVYNMILFKVENGKLSEDNAVASLGKVKDKMFQYIKENSNV